MTITREELEARLDERRRQERQAFANFNAAHGAVVELEQLLLLFDSKEPESDGKE